MAAFSSADGDEASLADQKKSHEAETADSEKSLAASGEELAEAGRLNQELEYNKDTPFSLLY